MGKDIMVSDNGLVESIMLSDKGLFLFGLGEHIGQEQRVTPRLTKVTQWATQATQV